MNIQCSPQLKPCTKMIHQKGLDDKDTYPKKSSMLSSNASIVWLLCKRVWQRPRRNNNWCPHWQFLFRGRANMISTYTLNYHVAHVSTNIRSSVTKVTNLKLASLKLHRMILIPGLSVSRLSKEGHFMLYQYLMTPPFNSHPIFTTQQVKCTWTKFRVS